MFWNNSGFFCQVSLIWTYFFLEPVNNFISQNVYLWMSPCLLILLRNVVIDFQGTVHYYFLNTELLFMELSVSGISLGWSPKILLMNDCIRRTNSTLHSRWRCKTKTSLFLHFEHSRRSKCFEYEQRHHSLTCLFKAKTFRRMWKVWIKWIKVFFLTDNIYILYVLWK